MYMRSRLDLVCYKFSGTPFSSVYVIELLIYARGLFFSFTNNVLETTLLLFFCPRLFLFLSIQNVPGSANMGSRRLFTLLTLFHLSCITLSLIISRPDGIPNSTDLDAPVPAVVTHCVNAYSHPDWAESTEDRLLNSSIDTGACLTEARVQREHWKGIEKREYLFFSSVDYPGGIQPYGFPMPSWVRRGRFSFLIFCILLPTLCRVQEVFCIFTSRFVNATQRCFPLLPSNAHTIRNHGPFFNADPK